MKFFWPKFPTQISLAMRPETFNFFDKVGRWSGPTNMIINKIVLNGTYTELYNENLNYELITVVRAAAASVAKIWAAVNRLWNGHLDGYPSGYNGWTSSSIFFTNQIRDFCENLPKCSSKSSAWPLWAKEDFPHDSPQKP